METLGFVGLGLMGSAMATRLQKAGHALIVHNRTKEKASQLLNAGARWGNSPADVSRQSAVVFSMISTPEVLRDISVGNEGILKGLNPGGIHVDCSTVSPRITRELAGEYSAKKCAFIHCPVLGSIPQATDGVLLLMAGGEQRSLEKIEPLLRVFGSKIWRFPRAEDASHAKLLCNLFIAGAISTLAQALAFAEKASVPPQTILDVISNSALNSPTYQTKGKSILEDNFKARFYVEHMFKDVSLMLEAANEKGVELPTIEVVQQLLSETIDRGFGKEDYSAIIKVLRDPPPHS